MKESHARLLKQFVDMATDGQFGDSIKEAQKEYDKLPQGIAILLKFVLDFCDEISKKNDELAQIRNLSCQLLIVAYREAKKRDPEIAQSLVNSFTTRLSRRSRIDTSSALVFVGTGKSRYARGGAVGESSPDLATSMQAVPGLQRILERATCVFNYPLANKRGAASQD